MTANEYYTALTSRNYLYIDDQLQARIKNSSLVFFGVGLSSNIVIQAVRLGFEKLTFCDGDKVELTNLNRQQYTLDQVGHYKVESLKETCLAINPHCRIETYPQFMTELRDHSDTIQGADLVVNTIDCGQQYFDLIEVARKKALVICPFNPGFSAFAVCFDKTSPSAFDYFKSERALDEKEVSAHVLNTHSEINLLPQIKMSSNEFLERVDLKGYYPQISIGASLIGGLVNHLMIAQLSGEKVLCAPHAHCIGGV